VVAASQIVSSRGADRIQLKSGVGIPEMNLKDEQCTGNKFICGTGAIIRRFLHREKDAVKNRSFKGQSHEIFDLWFFFLQTIPLGPRIEGLKRF
jgi:hypothetical protein